MGTVTELPTNEVVTAFQATQLGHLALTDAQAFWKALTPEQAARLLRAAPRIAGPWAKHNRIFMRRALIPVSTQWAACVESYSTETWSSFVGSRKIDHSTLKDAQDHTDAALRDAGWLLLDKEP